MRFAGKCVVVTGAGTGIGASAARMFLEEGAEVVAVQNRAPAPHASRRVTMDLSDPVSIRAAAAEMPERIDILCNIAGIGADGIPPEAVINTNFFGTRLFTELVMERVVPTGCVLNTASIAGRYWRRDIETVRRIMGMRTIDEARAFWATVDREHQWSYQLAKAAVIVWTMGLARDHAATGPRFNVMSPGFVDTPMLKRAFDDGNPVVRKLMESNNSISQPDDLAKVVLWLCSDEARVINGSDIVADDCLTATTQGKEYEY